MKYLVFDRQARTWRKLDARGLRAAGLDAAKVERAIARVQSGDAARVGARTRPARGVTILGTCR